MYLSLREVISSPKYMKVKNTLFTKNKYIISLCCDFFGLHVYLSVIRCLLAPSGFCCRALAMQLGFRFHAECYKGVNVGCGMYVITVIDC